jgi:hypothetical protein
MDAATFLCTLASVCVGLEHPVTTRLTLRACVADDGRIEHAARASFRTVITSDYSQAGFRRAQLRVTSRARDEVAGVGGFRRSSSSS